MLRRDQKSGSYIVEDLGPAAAAPRPSARLSRRRREPPRRAVAAAPGERLGGEAGSRERDARAATAAAAAAAAGAARGIDACRSVSGTARLPDDGLRDPWTTADDEDDDRADAMSLARGGTRSRADAARHEPARRRASRRSRRARSRCSPGSAATPEREAVSRWQRAGQHQVTSSPGRSRLRATAAVQLGDPAREPERRARRERRAVRRLAQRAHAQATPSVHAPTRIASGACCAPARERTSSASARSASAAARRPPTTARPLPRAPPRPRRAQLREQVLELDGLLADLAPAEQDEQRGRRRAPGERRRELQVMVGEPGRHVGLGAERRPGGRAASRASRPGARGRRSSALPASASPSARSAASTESRASAPARATPRSRAGSSPGARARRARGARRRRCSRQTPGPAAAAGVRTGTTETRREAAARGRSSASPRSRFVGRDGCEARLGAARGVRRSRGAAPARTAQQRLARQAHAAPRPAAASRAAGTRNAACSTPAIRPCAPSTRRRVASSGLPASRSWAAVSVRSQMSSRRRRARSRSSACR